MNIKITAIRKADYRDLQARFENPIEHACDVQELAAGRGNFYDGWMKDPHSAMISCNDGFRPVSFYIELAVSS